MTICQACGQPTSLNDPPVRVNGFVIHHSHLTDPGSGFYSSQSGPEEEQ